MDGRGRTARLLALMMVTVSTPLCSSVMKLLVALRSSLCPPACLCSLGACLPCASSPEDWKGQYWTSHSRVAITCTGHIQLGLSAAAIIVQLL